MTSTQADSICYTIINAPLDSDAVNEQNLRNQLGKIHIVPYNRIIILTCF